MPASRMTQDVAPGTFDPRAYRYRRVLDVGCGTGFFTDDLRREARAGDYSDLEDTRSRIAHDNLSLGVWRREPTV